jgi:hypothetical protein
MTLDLASLIERLTGEDKAQLEQIVAAGVTEKWIPQQGPQTEAYFSKADELLYGGSAGGGKSDLLIGLALNEAHNAVIFRNGLGNVRDLENRAVAVEGHRDGFSQNIHYWNRGDGRTLEFGSLEQPGSEESWQGRRRDFMGFDEAAQQMKSRIQFVLGWAGSAKAGARTRVIFATNPPLSDEGNWLIVWFAPWLDPMYPNPAKPGELRWFVNNREGDPVWVSGPGMYDRGDGTMSTAKSRTFIPSSLADNKYLRDTDYRSRVESLPEPMRSAMLNGNFMAARVDHQFQVFPSDWVREAQARWTPEGRKKAMLSLGVDVAGGGKDREVIARLHAENWFDVPLVHQGTDTKDGFAVAGRILAAQRGGAPIAIDMTGGWGGAPKTALKGGGVDATGCVFSEKSGAVDPASQIEFYNLRAEIMWHFRLALDPAGALVQGHPEDIALPPDAKLLAEMTTPRWSLTGGKILIEGKEEIKKRLGVSTDLLDAYMIAWWIRSKGIARQQNVNRRQSGHDSMPEADPFAADGF